MRKIDVLKRSVAGVCAATLLTGICAAPAFAVEVASGTPEDVVSGGTTQAKTEIKVGAEVGQISVTVPTMVSASVNSTGELTFPDSSTFSIVATNKSWPVKVTGVNVEVTQGYSLVENPSSAKQFSLALNKVNLETGQNDLSSMEASTNADGRTGVSMSGKLHNPAYGDVSSPITLVKLAWVVSV